MKTFSEFISEKGKGLWYNIHQKRKRGERMRKKGEKGAPTQDQIDRAKREDTGGIGFQAKGYMEYHPKNNAKFRKLTPNQ